MSMDLLLRYVIISIAIELTCAWMQTFQTPWPLVDAFELANNAEEQLFQSLGIIIDASAFAQIGAMVRMSSQAVCSLCNQSFRGSSHIPQEPSWAFEPAATICPIRTKMRIILT